MKFILKYLGIGLFIAGLVFSLGERFDIPFIESSKNPVANSEVKRFENEIASLKETIVTLENEVQQLSNENEELLKQAADTTISTNVTESTDSNKTNNEGNSNKSSNSSPTTAEIVTGTIYIYESVSIYDIGQQVEDLNIIENGRQLELFLAKPEYARSIQKGVFELRSDMTLEEMAKILTGKK